MRLVGVLWIKLPTPPSIVCCPVIQVLLGTPWKSSDTESFPQRVKFILQRFGEISLRERANVGLHKGLAKKAHYEGSGIGC